MPGLSHRRLPGVEALATNSTAEAARLLGEGDPALTARPTAAIAPRLAAKLYGLEILVEDVEDHPDNQTRFVSLARSGIPSPTGHDRTSIACFQNADHPGSLYAILGQFERRATATDKLESRPRIEFTGYLDEERLPDLFQTSSVAVMPYSSSTGCSGVAHLACAYGVPIVCSDLADFRQMAAGEDIAIDFYKPGSAQDLARCLTEFLTDPEKQQTMAVQNFSTALRMTMPTIVQKYLRHFELHQRAKALRYVTRFRKLPSWMPSKAPLIRMMTRNSLGWVHRSAVLASLRGSPWRSSLWRRSTSSESSQRRTSIIS